MELVTGFLNPAQGYEDKTFNLNSLLVKHPSATVFKTVHTSRYTHMGIYDGDVLVIDRAKQITRNSLVVYESEGKFVLGRVFNIKSESIITGAITSVIHFVREK